MDIVIETEALLYYLGHNYVEVLVGEPVMVTPGISVHLSIF